MASSIFELSVASQSINQGSYGAPMSMQRPRWFMVTPADYELTAQDYATGIQAKLQADAIHNDPEQRIQFIGPIQEAEDASSAPTTLEFGYGLTQELYPGQFAGVFYFGDGDLAKQQQRQTLDGQEGSRKVYLVDEKLSIAGTVGTNSTGGSVHTGFTPAALKARTIAVDFGSGAKQAMFVSLADSNEMNRGNLLVIPTKGFNPGAIKLVADVHVQAISALVTRVATLAFMSVNSVAGLNLAQKYQNELVSTPDLVLFTNHATGAALTITSAVATTIDGQHGITYTLSSTGYPSGAGAAIDVKLDDVSTLAAAGITYFETPQHLTILV